jgi:hypothetical protein
MFFHIFGHHITYCKYDGLLDWFDAVEFQVWSEVDIGDVKTYIQL